MDAHAAARRWKETWERAWPQGDAAAIAALYAEDAPYRALAFRDPDAPATYLRETFAEESGVECRFRAPLVDGDRAAVEWWASWIEDNRPVTLAGVTLLRFDAEGLVVDHRDYWNHADDRREPPYDGWD